jgi:lipopolysaccharide/colanic/teichoic acid biosynthesis glycosyltransferase
VLLVKHLIDKVLAIVLLLLAMPLLVIVALAVWFSLNESPFFIQVRVGKSGRKFKLVKFKTEKNGRLHGLKFLYFLRRSHIDEIPQLLNVIIGDMSLVGPRPHIPEHAAQYESWQAERLKMKPGITGLRQLSSPHKKLQFNQCIEDDIEYIRRWSLCLDFSILIRTLSSFAKLIFLKDKD